MAWSSLRQFDRRGKKLLHNPTTSPPTSSHFQPCNAKWGHCDCRPALIFIYTFLLPSFSQNIMTPDYMTAGTVADRADQKLRMRILFRGSCRSFPALTGSSYILDVCIKVSAFICTVFMSIQRKLHFFLSVWIVCGLSCCRK